jgi:hypothetical protein
MFTPQCRKRKALHPKVGKSILIGILGFLFFQGCRLHSDEPSSIVQINVNEALRNKGQLKLSDLVSEVQIVRFDTVKEAYFNNLQTAVVGEKFILISAGDPKQLMLFNREGKFIRQIGRRGDGPGEYLNSKVASMDPAERFIIVADYYSDRLIKFDFEGNLLKQIKLSSVTPAKIIDRIKFIDETHFALLLRRSSGPTDNYSSVITFDLDLNPGKTFLNRPNNEGLLLFNLIYNQLDYLEDGLAFWETYYDTIYHLQPNGLTKPAYLFIIENSGVQPDYFKDLMLLTKHTSDITLLHSIQEFPNYITANGKDHGKFFNLIYDKRRKDTFTLDHMSACDTTSRPVSSVINDIFGIEPLSLQNFDFNGKHLTVHFYPGFFRMTHDLDELSQLSVSNPELRNELIEIIRVANEEEAILLILKVKE